MGVGLIDDKMVIEIIEVISVGSGVLTIFSTVRAFFDKRRKADTKQFNKLRHS